MNIGCPCNCVASSPRLVCACEVDCTCPRTFRVSPSLIPLIGCTVCTQTREFGSFPIAIRWSPETFCTFAFGMFTLLPVRLLLSPDENWLRSVIVLLVLEPVVYEEPD